MIKYIQMKSVDYDELKGIWAASESSNQFTNMGPAKYSLERRLEALLEISEDKSVVCCSNGTLALHTIFLFLEKKGIVKKVSPAFTFPSCDVGNFRTRVVDIDLENYTMNLSEAIDDDIVIITNLFGTYPGNIKEIISFCKKENKVLIFDNASCPLTKIDGINFMNLGDYSFGSLHHTKHIGFGEGGFIVCPKSEREDLERVMGFGFKPNAKNREYGALSSNYKMSDVAAGAILQHINRYDFKSLMSVQKRFVEFVESLDGVTVFNYRDGVVLGNLPLLFDRSADKMFFMNSGVEAHKYYYPLKNLPNSMYVYDRILNLPLRSDMSDYEIDSICNAIEAYVKNV